MNFKFNKKQIIFVLSFLLIALSAIGCTLAYIFTNTSSVKNEFTSSKISSEVVETFDGNTKTNVSVKNTGNVAAYVRAAVIITWSSADGKNIYAQAPVENVDYEIDLNLSNDGNGWVKARDGFYYYTQPVAAVDDTSTEDIDETLTAILINLCKPKDGKAPSGYFLSVEIITSAVQSDPTSVVTEVWKSGVSAVNNKQLTIKEG